MQQGDQAMKNELTSHKVYVGCERCNIISISEMVYYIKSSATSTMQKTEPLTRGRNASSLAVLYRKFKHH